MRIRTLSRPRVLACALGLASVLPLTNIPVRADAPTVTITPSGVRIQIAATTLNEAIDALAQAASFRVTYEGSRPSAMLFNTDIEAPSVPQALLRLIDGQNLNYGLVMDPSGRTVSALIVLGVASPKPGAPQAPAGRPQPFTPPRPPRNSAEPLDQEPGGTVEPPVAPEPVPSPTVPVGRPGLPPALGPRMPFARPFGPRPTPTPTPLS